MIIFGQIERGDRLDIRENPPAALPAPLRLLGKLSLLFIMKENRGSVLTGKGRDQGIVCAPEHIEELRIGDHRGIVVDLNRLGLIPDSPVGRIVGAAPSVSDPGANDSGKLPKLGIGSPESP